MAGWLDLDAIAPGTPVFDADGVPLGPVEASVGDALRVRGQIVAREMIDRVDPSGIFLRLTRAAFAVGVPGATLDTTDRTPADDLVPVGGNTLRLPLAEERPVVTTREVDLGEIIIIKRVIEEERLVPVTLRHEVLERIRRHADGTETIEEMIDETQTTKS
jgi:hypothetical protein